MSCADPVELLRALGARSRDLGLPPPAAFLGDWGGDSAVLVPSVDLAPVAPERVWSAGGGPGGLQIGFRSYPEARADDPPILPAAVSGRAGGALILRDGTWSRKGDAPGPDELLETWGAQVASPSPAPFPTWTAPDRASHAAVVPACLEQIRAGEIYQVCLSTRLGGHLGAEPLQSFLSVYRSAPAARSAFLAGPWGAVLSFSPETYLSRRGEQVSSSPIKGTLPVGADPAVLRSNVKDVAENIMIVDLVRHDLGTVADTGSVVVTELLAVRPAPGVHHLVSTVTARSRISHDDLVEATFPPASVTGTPKTRARELIAGWEPRSRGLHCGAIGFSDGERLELSVAIRTLEVSPGGRVELGVGGGITIDSRTQDEWRECLDKAAFAWGGGPPPWGGHRGNDIVGTTPLG